MNDDDVVAIAKGTSAELLKVMNGEGDVSEEEIFRDSKGRRILKGDTVVFHGNEWHNKAHPQNKDRVGVVEWCRFGYSKRFFGENYLPLCMVKFPDGTRGGEISTDCVEKVGG